jgi:hypothetical protein
MVRLIKIFMYKPVGGLHQNSSVSLCWDRVLLCSPGCPQTHNPPASASQVQGLQLCTIKLSSTPNSYYAGGDEARGKVYSSLCFGEKNTNKFAIFSLLSLSGYLVLKIENLGETAICYQFRGESETNKRLTDQPSRPWPTNYILFPNK